VSHGRRDAGAGEAGWVFGKIVPGKRMRESVRPILRGCNQKSPARGENQFLEAALKVKTFVLIAELVFLLSIAGSAFAHHGVANYDMTKVVTLKGTVTDFQFINPHTLILFDVKNEKGEVEHWQAEATSPNHLVRAGWTRDIVKAGDQITISGYRAKNGTTIIRFQKMILANGQEVQEGGVDYR
jgi:hypothetical protein